VRNSNSNQKLGARPANRLQTENQAIEIINGFLRPIRSASQPEAVAPTSRIHKVRAKTMATSVSGTPKSLEIGTISSRKMVKSKASRVHPSQAATQASHWSLVGSFHHGIGCVFAVAADMKRSPCFCHFSEFRLRFTERPRHATAATGSPHRHSAVLRVFSISRVTLTHDDFGIGCEDAATTSPT
jgi:hypothetical protein